MAVTITVDEVTVAIRAATDAGNIAAPVKTVMSFLFPAAAEIVLDYAQSAPNSVHNAAVIRLCGWLFEADPANPDIGRALQVSGAAPLLNRWRVHRAGAFGQSGEAPEPQPGPAPDIPVAPKFGNFILTTKNGVLTWVEFPLPS